MSNYPPLDLNVNRMHVSDGKIDLSVICNQNCLDLVYRIALYKESMQIIFCCGKEQTAEIQFALLYFYMEQ